MRAYALVDLGDSEAIELFAREEDARQALEDCLADEPEWVGMLYASRSSSMSARPQRTRRTA